ncbi:hypothetical protein W02_06930 [Nitrospira sp. KM1]|uniref:heparinase II/III family protein n=1 Tax=Nitrospira sp. KM1 TaxID=1936990 RepID=UPI0013A7A704|nr:heparinase II/III family protein [Nitrospira sp. KM1]BCA53553.1 hypothetical protein W02_06930 [Nitrospira sp. KM1]
MDRIRLYAGTLRYLKLSQIVYFVRRRLCPSSIPKCREVLPPVRGKILIQSSPTGAQKSSAEHTLCFLNRKKTFSHDAVDWSSGEMPKLWRYNLHYFDYLNDPARSTPDKAQLVADWVLHVPAGMEDAWEPYTASLRIVNWIKFFNGDQVAVPPEWNKSLYHQALWLERNIEYHILANHYLKNGVALFFAGMYFQGDDADRWIETGLKILREELEEQFLSDGGHYERSPMYHCICVMDYLDVLNVMGSSVGKRFREFDHFRTRMNRSLDFLHDICLPDGMIPLFNDSAIGIAPAPDEIFRYAAQIIGYKRPQSNLARVAIEKPQSGYFALRNRNDMMVIDCGDIGPTYQPGHAHCDTLSYELAIDGRRVIVDSGIYDYQPSPQRRYARSTRAHNTVEIDGQEQSEMWGVFRVAQRARALHAYARIESDNRLIFEGSHNGYRRISGGLVHTRSIEYDGHSCWQVRDRIEGTGKHIARNYIHLHPDLHACLDGSSVSVRDRSGRAVVIIEACDQSEIALAEGDYYPEFGREMKNASIICTRAADAPMMLGYRITKIDSIQTIQ